MKLLIVILLVLVGVMEAQFSITNMLNRRIRKRFGINPDDPRGVLVDDGLPDDDDEDDDDDDSE